MGYEEARKELDDLIKKLGITIVLGDNLGTDGKNGRSLGWRFRPNGKPKILDPLYPSTCDMSYCLQL